MGKLYVKNLQIYNVPAWRMQANGDNGLRSEALAERGGDSLRKRINKTNFNKLVLLEYEETL